MITARAPHVPASSPIPVPATGSRARKPNTDATNDTGAVNSSTATAMTRPSVAGIHPNCTELNPVVATMTPRNPNDSGVPTGRSTIRLWESGPPPSASSTVSHSVPFTLHLQLRFMGSSLWMGGPVGLTP